MKNIPLLIGTIVGTLVLIVAVAFMFSGDSQTAENGSTTADPLLVMGDARNVKMEPEVPEAVAGDELNADNQADPDEELGEESTSDEKSTEEETSEQININQEAQDVITVVEFSDFQCPACKSVVPLVDSLVKSFPGKVRVVFRHFPLDSIHRNARKAATAAEAVSSINREKFWGMHDLLFENQTEWSDITDQKELNELFASYAEKLDIDRTQFLERIGDNSVAEMVSTDSNSGTQLGVNSTPTFYVNGVKVSAQELLTTVESLIVNTD